ncbi:hypothetical protein [Klebsiella michiganensis]|uniref:hypothetical protein n=1 Tax=Klebsiella michiganensis TaxID=1134687 RepID=UPI0007CC2DFF|nr:hypothetical protein [Klebsiella michiganensis]SAP88167.1 Uncharacterised protein [Klebsiella michiganensis]
MTITLQVNKLIQSLESAGELSIKERKYLELAKAFKQLAAENVALKAGRSYFMYSDDAGFETYPTREEAIKAAEEMIDDYRGDAGDGWPEEAGTTRWGVIIQQATECDYEKPSAENGWLGSCDYRLLPETPTTDRIVAGIKADGVEEWVSSRGGRWNGTIEEALKFAKQLREGKSEEVKL